MGKAFSILLFASFLFVFGCKKKEDINTDVTFINRIQKQVVLTVYPSFENYSNGTNPTLRKVLDGSAKLILPASTFNSGQTYYMDWYTDDYYYSNWYNDNFPQSGSQVAFRPVAGSSTYYIDPAYNGGARTVFLTENYMLSNWRAVNAYLYSSTTGYISQWASLSEFEKYRRITVNKNFTAQYEYKTSATQNATDQLSFKVLPSADANIEFLTAQGLSLGSMAAGRLPTGTAPDYRSTAKDTVMALLPNSDYYFMMVRE